MRPYKWSLSADGGFESGGSRESLPSGVNITTFPDDRVLELSGSPTHVGYFIFVVDVFDSAGSNGATNHALNVIP
jgi:hypothetical protein